MWSPRVGENNTRYGSKDFYPDSKSFVQTHSTNIIRPGLHDRKYYPGLQYYPLHSNLPRSRSKEYIIHRDSQSSINLKVAENKENVRPGINQAQTRRPNLEETKQAYFSGIGGLGSPPPAAKDGKSYGRLVLAPRPPKAAAIQSYGGNQNVTSDIFRRQGSQNDRRGSMRHAPTANGSSSRLNDHDLRLLERSRSRPAALVYTQQELQYSSSPTQQSRSPQIGQEKAFFLVPGVPKPLNSSKGSMSPNHYHHQRENTNLTAVHRTPFTAKDSSVSMEKSHLIRSGSMEHKNSVVMIPNSSVAVKNLSELEFDREIGKGSYAVVKLAYCKSAREKLAVKIYEKIKLADPLKRKSVDREISILQVLSHPYVIRYIAHFENKINIHLVMEYPGHKSLYEHVKSQPLRRLSESDCKNIMRKIFSAVQYLHSKDVAHRDLKLENLLYLSDGNIKIIDFGFAIRTKEKQKTFCGTPTYMAPEIVKRVAYKAADVDVWALGIMMYRMMTGVYPFMATNDKELYKKIVLGSYDSQPLPSPKARDLVSRILRVRPEERIVARDLLAHEWFAEHPATLRHDLEWRRCGGWTEEWEAILNTREETGNRTHGRPEGRPAVALSLQSAAVRTAAVSRVKINTFARTDEVPDSAVHSLLIKFIRVAN